MTPHARDLPIRRALMYSDWEQHGSAAVIGADEGLDTDAQGNRKLALRDPLTDFTTGIVSASVVSECAGPVPHTKPHQHHDIPAFPDVFSPPRRSISCVEPRN